MGESLTGWFFCAANFCSVDTDRDPKFISDGVKFIGNGEKLRLECVETGIFPMYSDGVCTDGRISFSACKYKFNFTAVNDSSIIVQ